MRRRKRSYTSRCKWFAPSSCSSTFTRIAGQKLVHIYRHMYLQATQMQMAATKILYRASHTILSPAAAAASRAAPTAAKAPAARTSSSSYLAAAASPTPPATAAGTGGDAGGESTATSLRNDRASPKPLQDMMQGQRQQIDAGDRGCRWYT